MALLTGIATGLALWSLFTSARYCARVWRTR